MGGLGTVAGWLVVVDGVDAAGNPAKITGFRELVVSCVDGAGAMVVVAGM